MGFFTFCNAGIAFWKRLYIHSKCQSFFFCKVQEILALGIDKQTFLSDAFRMSEDGIGDMESFNFCNAGFAFWEVCIATANAPPLWQSADS